MLCYVQQYRRIIMTASLTEILEKRFSENMKRHPDVTWETVAARLSDAALASLTYMEETGGEPDVIGRTNEGRIIYCDTSKESPSGRRSLCYDETARMKRKANRPDSSAVKEAEAHGLILLEEEDYMALQKLGDFDQKSTTWLKTPETIRKAGGAIFGDKKYGRTFIYHNGADSYYSNRGFRAKILL